MIDWQESYNRLADAAAASRAKANELEKQLEALLAWQAKYREAAELWDSLEPADGQQIVSAVLIGKMVNFEGESKEDRAPTISISSTDDVDWMDQMGIVDSAHDFIHSDPWKSRD